MTAQNVVPAQDTETLVRERTSLELAIKTVGRIIKSKDLTHSQKEQMIGQITSIIDVSPLDYAALKEKISEIKQAVSGQNK